MKIRNVCIAMLLGSAFVACSKNDDSGLTGVVDCSKVTNKSFAAHVQPVIQASCATATCHETGSINGPGPLTNYTEIFNARINIRSAVANNRMPKNSTLSASQKNSVICWIDGGAQDN